MRVLNASRHHRKNRPVKLTTSRLVVVCSTPRGITGKIAILRMELQAKLDRCSTPRGITGKIAGAQGRESVEALLVLNASRHHRKNRVGVLGNRRKELLQCSTPRGITGKIAATATINIPPLQMCSTPRGITGKIASAIRRNSSPGPS